MQEITEGHSIDAKEAKRMCKLQQKATIFFLCFCLHLPSHQVLLFCLPDNQPVLWTYNGYGKFGSLF